MIRGRLRSGLTADYGLRRAGGKKAGNRQTRVQNHRGRDGLRVRFAVPNTRRCSIPGVEDRPWGSFRKATYDPTGFFRYNGGVVPAAVTE